MRYKWGMSCALGAILASPAGVFAQVRCTMPNGVVIEQALSSTCPRGAVRAETMDGRPLPNAAQRPPAVAPALVRRKGYEAAQEIERGEWGGGWPLTVPGGTLRCEIPDPARPQLPAITFQVGGTRYPVNGIARGWASRKGWAPDIAPIWMENRAIPGTKVPLTPLTQRGLSLCTK